MKLHNTYRQKHRDTPDLAWDNDVAASAQKYANYLARTGQFKHSNSKYGENLYKSWGSFSDSTPCYNAVKGWLVSAICFLFLMFFGFNETLLMSNLAK